MDKGGNPSVSVLAQTRASKSFAWRSPLRFLCTLLALWLLSFTTPALAAADVYRLYIDPNASPATGCAATLTDRYGSATLTGFAYRVTIAVDAAGNASQPTLAACEGGDFGADTPIGQAAPKTAQRAAGAHLLAQLELMLPASAIQATSTSRVILASNGDYIRYAKVGNSAPITLSPPAGPPAGTGATPIPTLAPALLAALAAALAALAIVLLRKRAASPLLALLLIAFMGSGLAAGVLAIDGNTDDWQGIAPVAVDFTGDQVPGTHDLYSLTAQFQDSDLYLRIDTIAGPNPLRDLSPLEAQSDQPRFLTQPSLNATVGQSWSYGVQASSPAGQPLSVSLTQAPAGLQITGSAPNQQLTWTPTAAGTYWVTLQIQDGGNTQTQKFPLYVSDDSSLPPNPTSTATALAPVGFTSFPERTKFLYEGTPPVQTGVATGAIDPVTATVVVGQVLDQDGQPMPGVTIRIAGHPEWGQTQTRADGKFDMAAGGGGWLTVDYQKAGHMRAQRRIQSPWRDFAYAPDVALLPYDSQYSQIDLSAGTPQLYWGASHDDGRGQRRASIYFPAGTQAQMQMPGGSTQPLTHFTMRATEYTLGASGPQSMPGQLPMSVGYTWAANFTADEAEAAGAQSIQFTKPVVTYVDNFIAMPVGTAVPVGWYDFDQTTWIGENNGRIIKILGVDAQGQAILQVTTDARAATAQELLDLGIDSDELKQIASTRAVGSVLWRVALAHLTPWDYNWPYGPPPDALPPPTRQPNPDPNNPPPNTDPPVCPGCDVFMTQRAIGQGIDLPGTPLSLYYRSDRIDLGSRTLQVRVTDDATPPPASLQRIDVTTQITGITQTQSLGGWSANQIISRTWNGKDAYGRLQPSGTNAYITVSYVYPVVYYPVSADFNRAFDQLQARIGTTAATISSNSVAGTISVSRSYTRYLSQVNLPSAEVSFISAGNWALKGLRMYDAEAGRVYEGGGNIWDATQQPRRFAAITDTLSFGATATPPAPGNSAVGADGALYYSDTNSNQIRRIWLYGERKSTVEIVAGTGTAGYNGDGGPATAAQLNQPTALALAPDGGIVFMDYGNRVLRRITAAGVIQTVAGNGESNYYYLNPGTSVPALSVPIWTSRIAVAGDMSIFVQTSNYQLWQITPAGYVSSLSVNNESLSDLASAPTGQVWLSTSGGLYQFTDVGTLRKISSSWAYASGLLADTQGGAFFYDSNNAFNYISRAGAITLLGKNFADTQSSFGSVKMLGVAPGGDLIASSYGYGNFQVGTLGASLPAFGDPVYRVARPDGTTMDEFDVLGRPVATRSTFGGQALLTYEYGPTGQLTAVKDSYGNTTTLIRDANGLLTTVKGPFGQVTTLSYTGNQLTGVMQPGSLQYTLQYASSNPGLLTQYTDPGGNVDRFSYDANKLLVSNADPIGGGWHLNPGASAADYWANTNTYSVSAQSTEGRTSNYATTNNGWNYNTVTTAPDGTQTTSNLSSGYSLTETQPNGATSTTYLSTDPRLGGAVLRNQTVNFGSGNYLRLSTTRSLSNSHAVDSWQDPQGWRETTTLNSYTSWVTTYQDPGLFTQTTPMGRTSSVQLDQHQQPASATLPSGLQLAYSYNSAGQITGISSTDGTNTRTASLTWKPVGGPTGGKLASWTNALGQTQSFDYDDAGRLTKLTLPDSRTLQYQWDNAGNLTSLTTPANVTHTFNYNGVQQPTGYTPQGGSITQWNYDRDRLLTSIVRPGGQSLQVQRDPAIGRITALVDSVSGPTQLSYDSAGRLASTIAQDGQAMTYDYGGTALLQNMGLTLQNGASVSLKLGYALPYINQVTLTAGGQTQNIATTYDSDGLPTSNGPLLLGRDVASGQLTSLVLSTNSGLITDSLVTNNQHNAWGQLTSSQTYKKTSIAPNANNSRQAVRALISALGTQLAGNISGRGDCVSWWLTHQECIWPTPNTPICTTTPTNADEAAQANLPWPPQPPQWTGIDMCQPTLQAQIANLLQLADRGTPAAIDSALQSLITSFSSGPSTFLSTDQYLTGTPATYTTTYIDATAQSLIDQINATLDIWYTGQTIWAPILSQTHTRDALARITQTQETLLSAAAPTTKSYTYDPAGRLTSATVGGTTTTWAYDANGNRTQENGQPIATYDTQDRLLTWKGNSYTYNAAGDLASKTTPSGTTGYTYDAQGNLRKVTLPNGKTIAYAIDPSGRRTGKRINDALQWQLVWMSSLRPLARLNASNTLDQTYYYGDKPNVPEAMSTADGKTYRIVSDQNGSVRLVIDASTGEVAQQIDYDTWGKITNDTNPGFQPFGFAGGLYDPDTGLTRFGVRDYDAETGRWTAKDPILFGGGDSNLYGYVAGDPINGIDPRGLSQEDLDRAISIIATCEVEIWNPNVKVTLGKLSPSLMGKTDFKTRNITLSIDSFGGNLSDGQKLNLLSTLAHEYMHSNQSDASWVVMQLDDMLGGPLGLHDDIERKAINLRNETYKNWNAGKRTCGCGG